MTNANGSATRHRIRCGEMDVDGWIFQKCKYIFVENFVPDFLVILDRRNLWPKYQISSCRNFDGSKISKYPESKSASKTFLQNWQIWRPDFALPLCPGLHRKKRFINVNEAFYKSLQRAQTNDYIRSKTWFSIDFENRNMPWKNWNKILGRKSLMSWNVYQLFDHHHFPLPNPLRCSRNILKLKRFRGEFRSVT